MSLAVYHVKVPLSNCLNADLGTPLVANFHRPSAIARLNMNLCAAD